MPRRLGPLPAVLAALTVVISVATLSACTGEDDDPSSSAGSPTASPTEPSSSDAATEDAEPPGPTGPVIEGEGAVLTLPSDYRVLERGAVVTSAEDEQGRVYVGYSELNAVGPDTSLDEQAALARRNALTDPPPKILEPVTVDGVELYHVAGVGFSVRSVLDEFGARVGNTDFSVRVEMDDDIPEAERQEIVAQVIAGLDVAD